MRGKRGNDFTVSANAARVRFGLGVGGKTPRLFDVSKLTLEKAEAAPPGLHRPDISGLNVEGWKNTREPKLNGKPLKLEQYERSRSLAIAPDAASFMLGTEWRLRRFGKDGKQLWEKPAPGVVWGVNLSSDGEIAVAAYDDGTIRWHRASGGQELLALFVHARTGRWVAWTPKGYYAASPGGEDLIGWHLNRGYGDAPDFFPASRFRKRFYRPDIVQLVLNTLDEAKAVKQANRAARRKQAQEDIRKSLPPVVTILSPRRDAGFSSREVTFEYSLRSPSGAKVTRVDVLIDGRPLSTRGLERTGPVAPAKRKTITVTLPDRSVEVALIAHTANAASVPARVKLIWTGGKAKSSLRPGAAGKPNLYALLIGVSKYERRELSLFYAAKDAGDLDKALKAQAGGMYGAVKTRLLMDARATAANIGDGLSWLEDNVGENDMALVFLAGHGVTDAKQRFYFLPVDGDPNRLRGTAIAQITLQDSLSSLAGKVLMFIDACHAGQGIQWKEGRAAADITAVVNTLSSAENGIVMFASSTGRELSIEDHRWENGAFTEALLEGLAGKADFTGDKAISVTEMSLWLSERVKQLTGNAQHPVTGMPETVPDFQIALVR